MKGNIRKACEEDAKSMVSIYNEYVLHTTISFETEALSEELMKERLRAVQGNFPWLVYEENGSVLGYCYAHLWKSRAAYRNTWESTIYLAPGYLHRGIGRGLMQELISASRAAGCRILIACITANNHPSRDFHEKLGFRQVSHFPAVGEKMGEILDVVDFELML